MEKGSDPRLRERIRQVLREKGKIEAIKEYLHATRSGLKVSTDFVNALEREELLARRPNRDSGK